MRAYKSRIWIMRIVASLRAGVGVQVESGPLGLEVSADRVVVPDTLAPVGVRCKSLGRILKNCSGVS